jgi:cytochrome bd-type quinol oxidase subunit 2
MLATDGGSPRLEPNPDAPEHERPAGTLLATGHRLRWWKELLFTGAIYLVYESTRNLTKSGASVAYENALEIIRAQKWLRINIEYDVQRFFIDDRWLIVTSNYFYGAGYVVSTLFALIWLYRKRPDHYPFWRNTLAVGTLLGLLGFRFYPLMPPRLLDVQLQQLVYGFVDTLKQFPTLWSFDNSAMEKVSNQYAAMPSLHCGWALWVMMATIGLVRTQVMRVVVVLLPVATIFVVVVTANHYLLDAVGGLIIMLGGYGVALLITRAGYVPLRGYRMKGQPGFATMPTSSVACS